MWSGIHPEKTPRCITRISSKSGEHEPSDAVLLLL